MSEEVVLNRFNKLACKAGKTVAIIVMWNELSQEMRNALTVMDLFWAYEKAHSEELKHAFREEVLGREDIPFKQLKTMHLNIVRDDEFKSAIEERMKKVAQTFDDYSELQHRRLEGGSAGMLKTSSSIEEHLNVLDAAEESKWPEVIGMIAAGVAAGEIDTDIVSGMARRAFGYSDSRKEGLFGIIKGIEWPFEKWEACRNESYTFDGVSREFFLGMMRKTAKTFDDRMAVYKKSGCLPRHKDRQMIRSIMGMATNHHQFSVLCAESIYPEEQKRIIRRISKLMALGKLVFPLSDLSLLGPASRKRSNWHLLGFFEGLEADKASTAEEWEGILDSSKTVPASYSLQRISEMSETIEEWANLYDLSRRNDCPSMANKALNELKILSASL